MPWCECPIISRHYHTLSISIFHVFRLDSRDERLWARKLAICVVALWLQRRLRHSKVKHSKAMQILCDSFWACVAHWLEPYNLPHIATVRKVRPWHWISWKMGNHHRKRSLRSSRQDWSQAMSSCSRWLHSADLKPLWFSRKHVHTRFPLEYIMNWTHLKTYGSWPFLARIFFGATAWGCRPEAHTASIYITLCLYHISPSTTLSS